MNTEEKARRYDEALNWMREIYPGLHGATKEYAEHFFPELAESEDERIRKAIIELLKEVGRDDTGISENAKCMIDYLEKQKEQHPSTKFRPGDWVVYDGPLGHAILQVKDVVDGRYTFVDNDSTLLEEDSNEFLRHLTPEDVEKPAESRKRNKPKESWLSNAKYEIEHADELLIQKQEELREIRELKQKEQKPIIQDVELNDAVYDYVRDHFIAGADFTPEYIKKLMENAFFAGVDYYLLKQESESCELDTNVEKVIEDVIRVYGKTQGEWVGGYDVDTLIVNLRRAFNKKEQKPAEKHDLVAQLKEHLANTPKEQLEAEWKELEKWNHVGPTVEEYLRNIKLAEWNKNDEAFLKVAIAVCNRYSHKDIADWLKSLPERFNLEPKEEWNEEDEEIFNNIIEKAKGGYWIEVNEITWLITRFKSLHPQYHGDVTMTEAYKMGKEAGKASHWELNEEDKQYFDDLIARIEKSRSTNRCYVYSDDVDWLKSKLNGNSCK